jgi:hypothetical protein
MWGSPFGFCLMFHFFPALKPTGVTYCPLLNASVRDYPSGGIEKKKKTHQIAVSFNSISIRMQRVGDIGYRVKRRGGAVSRGTGTRENFVWAFILKELNETT